jgi:hypothetical protein
MIYRTLINLMPLGIPLILLISGGFAKKLIRGSGWAWRDFYLGIEFSLATMSAALVNIVDLAKGFTNIQNISENLIKTVLCLVGTFLFFIIIMCIHQDWENRDDNENAKRFLLAVCCNLLGASMLTVFVLLVKGVK